MRQKNISIRLKALDLAIAVLVAIYFIGITITKIIKPELFFYETASPVILIIFSWITAICIFVVLKEFWDVCTQIGDENSFSIPNAKSFHRMNICGIISNIAFAIRLIWIAVTGYATLYSVAILVGEILLGIMFCVIAESLSGLVMHAYEVKHENELTI